MEECIAVPWMIINFRRKLIRMKRNLPAKRARQWNEGRLEEAYQLALLGATDAQMARIMGVDSKTFEYWKRTKQEFRTVLEEGKSPADAKVATALFRLACGYEMEEEHLVTNKFTGETKIMTVKRRFKPDGWAAAKWLALRQRELWAEIQRVESTNTNLTKIDINMSALSTDELTLIKKIGLKQLVEHVRDINQN